MRVFRLIPLFAFAVLTVPAAAELAPEAYARARAAADAVLVVDIARVEAPAAPFDSAVCTVHGRVAAVERGAFYRVAQDMAIALPCVGALYRPIPGPFPGYLAERLADVRRARLYLDGQGDVVARGFDPLPPAP